MDVEQQQGTWSQLSLFEVEEGSVRPGASGEGGTGTAAFEEWQASTALNRERALNVKKKWYIPTVGAEFVWRMEDVLDVYAAPIDPKRPRVCFDEHLVQLIIEKRQPLPAKPGRPERYDYEYQRNGTRNLYDFHALAWSASCQSYRTANQS